MSKGKKYNIPRKYLHKYSVRKWNYRYKIIGGKNGEKVKFKFFRYKKLWKSLDGHVSMRKMMVRYNWYWD